MNRREDRGFTLIELLIAVVLSGIVAGVTVAALVTSLNVASSTTAQVADSTDASLVSSFLIRDAQSSGGIDPTTGLPDASLGVSTDSSGWAGCTQPGSLVVRFSWIDRTSASAQTSVVVTYAIDAQSQLTRRICKDGTTVDLVLGSHINSAVATCRPTSCSGAPTAVSLAVTGIGTRAPLAYELTASIRGDAQAPPTSTNSSPVPLLALGAPATSAMCPNLTLAGTGAITVIGDVLVDGSCGTAPIGGDQTLLRPTGSTNSTSSIIDPFRRRQAPNSDCALGGSNPAIIGQSVSPDTVTVYQQPVTIAAAVAFQPGRYVFCAGLSIISGTVSGVDVLFYIAGGTLAVDAQATVDLTGRAAGDDVNLLIWVATPQTITLDGGSRVSTLRGSIYAPTSTLRLSSVVAGNIGGLVVKDLRIAGAGALRVGQPIAELSITPASMPPAQVGLAYATGLSTTGGTSPHRWVATGLPPGLTLDSANGTLSGTPTVAGLFEVVMTTFDATDVAGSIDYTISVPPLLTIAGPMTLPTGQASIAYPPSVVTTAGGTAPITWSATGLPAGLTIGAGNGTIGGTPLGAGTFNAVVTATDAMSATAAIGYTITILPRLTVTGTTLPSGQVAVPYAATTMTSTGGAAPYTWTATGLPAGVAIVASTGVVSGTPGAAGTFNVVVTVTDAMAVTALMPYTVTIAPAAVVPPGCGGPFAGWRGEYYSNMALTAPATLCRDDTNINFNWGSGVPVAGVPADNFSARWTRTQQFAAGRYTFSLGSDDGARLFIDGVLVLDRWVVQSYAIATVAVDLTDGSHTVVVEYFATTGTARATLTWVASASPSCSPAATGWKGEYFSNVGLTGLPAMCRDDPSVNFDWGSGASAAGMPSDNFSVRWTKSQTFVAGTYAFALGTDDGGRLYIDGALVINQWVDQAYPSPQPTVIRTLSTGAHTIIVHYYDRTGDARATLTTTLVPNGVTAVASVAGDRRFYGENIITLSNTSTITAMTVTINVAQTTGLTYNGQYTTIPSSSMTLAHPITAGFLRYTFVLRTARTIAPGSWTLAGQWNGTGTLHPNSGDTWTVTTTSAGIVNTISGTF